MINIINRVLDGLKIIIERADANFSLLVFFVCFTFVLYGIVRLLNRFGAQILKFILKKIEKKENKK